MELKEILFEEKGPVAIITLNRPDRMNALTMVTHRELEKAINYVEQEDRIRQVCLRLEFNVIPGIFGNVLKECVQVLGQFCRRETIILDMVLLLEDDSI